MMRFRFVVSCVLCALASLLPAALLRAQNPVTITGDAPFAKNEEIRLLVYDDLLNNIPHEVASSKIDKNGRFKLTYPTNTIRQVQLVIRTTKADFFVAPFHEYNFHITVDTALFGMINPEKYGGFLQITTDVVDTADLNVKINRFTRYFDNAMNYYGFKITYDRNQDACDTLMRLLDDKFHIQYNPDNFYSSYVYYTCGLVDKLCKPKEVRYLHDRYFNNNDVLYDNPAYMILFNNFYSNYLYNSKYISKDLLTQTVNEDPDYLTLFNEAGRDPMLVNDRFRELVIIRSLIDFYSNEEFDRANILTLLKYIQDASRFPEHVTYARNAIRMLSPEAGENTRISLRNEKGKKTDFSQYDGKEIYIQVFQSDCMDCIREMLILSELNKQYGDRIQIVSLNVDMRKSDYEQFCKTYKDRFDWPILYFNDNYNWLMMNSIETLPDYLIVNSDGLVLLRDAPAPDKGLSDYLLRRFPPEENDDGNPLFQNRR